MGFIEAISQSKPKGDIIIAAWILIFLCLLQIVLGVILVVLALAFGFYEYWAMYLCQWTFALLAVFFPFFGILGAWKTMMTALIIFLIYLAAQIFWTIIYFFLIGALGTGARLIVHLVFNFIEFVLSIAMFVLALVILFAVKNFRDKQRE